MKRLIILCMVALFCFPLITWAISADDPDSFCPDPLTLKPDSADYVGDWKATADGTDITAIPHYGISGFVGVSIDNSKKSPVVCHYLTVNLTGDVVQIALSRLNPDGNEYASDVPDSINIWMNPTAGFYQCGHPESNKLTEQIKAGDCAFLRVVK